MELLGRSLSLRLDNPKKLACVCRALSNEQRLQILRCFQDREMNLREIAHELGMPVSSVGVHVAILEEAGLIRCETRPGARGNVKSCTPVITDVRMDLTIRSPDRPKHKEEFSIPVGCYALAEHIRPTCGIAFDSGLVFEDDPRLFNHPLHSQAGLVWFTAGAVEYRLPPPSGKGLKSVEISFEACSETFGHNDVWPSDIAVSLNDVPLGTWRCPGDFGGRRGRLTPAFWHPNGSQYGQLHVWRTDESGTQLDDRRISDTVLSDLSLDTCDCVRMRIGLAPDGIAGGINLFGKTFGDHPQDILLRYISEAEAST